MKKTILTTVVLLATLSHAYGQEGLQPQTKLQNIADTYLQQYGDIDHRSGLEITAQCKWPKNNSNPVTVYSGKMGFNDSRLIQDHKDSIWDIASITKSFTSVVVLQLEGTKTILPNGETHIFSLDDTVEQWFPEYTNWHEKGGVKATIRQLMNMTAGVPNFLDKTEGGTIWYDTFVNHPYDYYTLEDVLDFEKDKPLVFVPGTRMDYSNTNYTLLGLLIKKITKNDPGIEIKQRIIDKLKLSNTYYVINDPTKPYSFPNIPYSGPEISNQLMHQYYYGSYIQFNQGTDTINFSHSLSNTAGGVLSNSEDINTYIHSLFNPGEILNESQIKQLTSLVSGSDDPTKSGKPMTEPTKEDPDGYALGVWKRYDSAHNTTYWYYIGGATGGQFEYYYYPEKQISFTVPWNSMIEDQTNQQNMDNNVLDYMWNNCQ